MRLRFDSRRSSRRHGRLILRPCFWFGIALLISTSAVPASAGEVRLYRIVGSELELYNRVECDVELDSTAEVQQSTLREAGLFDIHPDDMADEARRLRSRGDGLLWDAPRARWIGFSSEESSTLITLAPDEVAGAFLELYTFEPVRESYSLLWSTNDPNVFFATFEDIEMQELPTVARIEFNNDADLPSIEMWDISDRDPERMNAAYGTPFAQHEYRNYIWTVVSQASHLFTLASNVTMWEFGVLPPARVFNCIDASHHYLHLRASPDGELFAAMSSDDRCYIDLWKFDEETPFLSIPLQESGWLNGGCVAFTPDGQYLWYDSIFSHDVRVWRCEDWVELDAYRIEGKDLNSFIRNHSAEWIVVSRDEPFEAEPTDWIERGPFEPADTSARDREIPRDNASDFVSDIVEVVIAWLDESRERRQTRMERRRHRRQLPRRPPWDEE